ncbi:hypothetical protein AB0J48_15235 [Nocardia salmonicida]|uniref:hypothetical protein n=1 Tax=Nocardia salmonicida TaxID=53431 RepID=UPI0034481471
MATHTAEPDVAAPADTDKSTVTAPEPGARSVTVSVPALIATALAALAVLAAIIFGVLWLSARGDVAAIEQRAADDRQAETTASTYAVGASQVDFKDLGDWVTRLKTGTTPELSAKFDATAPKLQEILTPMRWTSTGTAISAKVQSRADSLYTVNVFVDVKSTSAQSEAGTRTTVTYAVTLDSARGWTITDVGGIGGILPLK